MIEGSVFGIIDVTKPFKVEIVASDYVLEDVLLQNEHFIAYESRILNATKKSATCYFFSQPKLTSKQARWQEFLVEFAFRFEHKKGSSNRAANVLSRKNELRPCAC
ncbi:reverse transcriptase [Cucumis melo var. makuwa]|uniref:Reverse transcriptase n=1 Tax=Cucumis melo var. makuwa TaxID=1194695 RepID=A0A5D3CUW2_CUCMM|nr:reverse transcriptase [Cucumis melo var. makuwa]TYK15018.1 reverse transcriptase [Cucumis melo var. makuwa]